MRTGIIYDDIFLEHATGDHPENARRLVAITAHLKRLGIWEKLEMVDFDPATPVQMSRVHSTEQLRRVRELAEQGGGMADMDTVISPRSYEVALSAAGGLIGAVETVVSGRLDCVYALVRPPGHHATREKSMGFCLFNNIAVGAAHALDELCLERILIIDWDVHRGNGTQSIFKDEPRVRYITVHQNPLYPGPSGAEGTNASNIEVPLPPGCGEAEYIHAMDEIIIPAARHFHPQIIMVSAGYDAHWMDDISLMRLSATSYALLTHRVKSLARELCGGRLVFSLEGGYHSAALPACVTATLSTLLEITAPEDMLGSESNSRAAPDISDILENIKTRHGLS